VDCPDASLSIALIGRLESRRNTGLASAYEIAIQRHRDNHLRMQRNSRPTNRPETGIVIPARRLIQCGTGSSASPATCTVSSRGIDRISSCPRIVRVCRFQRSCRSVKLAALPNPSDWKKYWNGAAGRRNYRTAVQIIDASIGRSLSTTVAGCRYHSDTDRCPWGTVWLRGAVPS